MHSLWNLRNLDAGFHPDGVLTLRIKPNEIGYTRQRRAALWKEILERAGRTPGVRSASLSALTPLSGMERGVLIGVPGFRSQSVRDTAVSLNHVTAGYFETMGIPVVLGRGFNVRDSDPAPRVALLNESAARFLFLFPTRPFQQQFLAAHRALTGRSGAPRIVTFAVHLPAFNRIGKIYSQNLVADMTDQIGALQRKQNLDATIDIARH